MSLRYRLFLWVSAVFVVSAFLGYLSETFVTKRALKKAKEELCQKILSSKEPLAKNLTEFLIYQMMENQAKIDVVLNGISHSSSQLVKFAPTLENASRGTWSSCADLLENNRWIDFIQNTNDSTPTAVIFPQSPPFAHVFRIPIDEDLSWVFTCPSDAYIGIRLFALQQEYPTQRLDGEEIEELSPSLPETYLLFPLELLAKAEKFSAAPSLSPPWIEGHAISLIPFMDALERARLGLSNGTLIPPKITESEIQKKIAKEGRWEESLANPFPGRDILSLIPKGEFLETKMNDFSMRNGEINILWMLLSLFNTGIFGDDLFAFPSPTGVSTFKAGYNTGPIAYVTDIFSSSKIFDDEEYFAKNKPKNVQSNIATAMAIIKPVNRPNVYLGNTAEFAVHVQDTLRKGYLTLACDADDILEQLVLSLHQTAFLVTGGEIASAFWAGGKKFYMQESHSLVLSEILDKKMGIVHWSDEEFFFLNLMPFPTLDLHFVLLNPVDKEFALLFSLEEGSQQVAHSILFNIQMSGFALLFLTIILLHYFAKGITAPIIQLAHSAQEVKEGKLDEVKIPSLPSHSKDEVAMLVSSFQEMVKGLKEKEKVKGILNKVVSQEVAREILAGKVHLGGEEKRVTVLFADIRNFTGMTQSMLPHQVVDLLNTCMTKISACVDRHQGVIDKYIGDEAMALFGAPIVTEDSALSAVICAVEMIFELKKWNKERAEQKLNPVEMGIGIHTGEMLVGNMGAENRLNYTVIGSNVNLAARICSAAKGMEILISKETLHEHLVQESVLYEELPPMTLKGFDTPVILYRVQGIKR